MRRTGWMPFCTRARDNAKTIGNPFKEDASPLGVSERQISFEETARKRTDVKRWRGRARRGARHASARVRLTLLVFQILPAVYGP